MRGLKVTRVVTDLGFSPGSMSTWKKGHNPQIKTIEKFSSFFDVSVDYFLDLEGKEKAPVPKDERQIKIETLMHLLYRMTPEQLDSFIVIAEGMVK